MQANGSSNDTAHKPLCDIWHVYRNVPVCDEHYRLTLRSTGFPDARPGQFVTLAPPSDGPAATDLAEPSPPFLLRRAFSIADLRRGDASVEIDILHHAVGAATRWMAGLVPQDRVSVIGPLGNGFPPPSPDRAVWLLGGGIGLPPVLWLANTLAGAGQPVVLFVGARTTRLLPLTLRPGNGASTPSVTEVRGPNVSTVLCTDDGSLGYRGTVLAALQDMFTARSTPPDSVTLYGCGPEAMLQALGAWAVRQGLDCHLCTERTMACGMGTCQSCVIPVRAGSASDGWAYKLCCTDGPVFAASEVLWSPPG
jgi:dihydroorotate dehydrogenase electron transfer subunit